MDIKNKVDEIVESLKDDEATRNNFFKNPLETVEKKFNIDLPDEKVQEVIEAVKEKLAGGEGVKGFFEGLKDKFTK